MMMSLIIYFFLALIKSFVHAKKYKCWQGFLIRLTFSKANSQCSGARVISSKHGRKIHCATARAGVFSTVRCIVIRRNCFLINQTRSLRMAALRQTAIEWRRDD